MKTHRGTLILVFGILGIVCCFPLGIAAWVMGSKDLKEMNAGTMDPGGRGATNAGRVCGMIGTLLFAILSLPVGVALAMLFLWQSGPQFPAPEPPEPPARMERKAPEKSIPGSQLTAVLSEATRERPWINSLGMPFVPVPRTKVLFCIWETRVQDYAEYAGDSRGVDDRWINPELQTLKVTPREDCPVVYVSWEDAKAFCQWLTQKEQREGSLRGEQTYRLPTDAEWSLAVGLNESSGGNPMEKSGKTEGVYPWGRQWPPPAGAGNYGDETWQRANLIPGYAKLSVIGYDDKNLLTSPVGSFQPNEFGIYDLGGNVWEWCEDSPDKEAPKARVIRGGSYSQGQRMVLLSSYRERPFADVRSGDFGFRTVIARTSLPQEPPSR